MNLCELRPAEGSREKNWRRGRGHATGNGKTAGRGHKGQGQPFRFRRQVQASKAVRCLCTEDSLKEASHAETAKEIVAINVSMLNVFENDAVVDIDALKAVGLDQ